MPVSHLVSVVGLCGSWLLVIGPAYQGVLEITTRRREVDGIRRRIDGVLVRPVPRWAWIFPPLALAWWSRRLRDHVEAVKDVLPDGPEREWVGYLDSVIGWALVAAGGLLTATAQTLTMAQEMAWWLPWTSWAAGVLLTSAMTARMVGRRV